MNEDLGALKNCPDLSVTEHQLREVLRGYNLRDGLIFLGQVSSNVFNGKIKEPIGRGAARHIQSGVFITQFSLAYLANILIISGSNDWKKKQIQDKDNGLGLVNIYSNNLLNYLDLKSLDENINRPEKIRSMMVPMFHEQFIVQKDPIKHIGRTSLFFVELLGKVTAKEKNQFKKIFKEENGLELEEYLTLGLLIFACIYNGPLLNPYTSLIGADIPNCKHLLTKENIDKFMKLVCLDHREFAELDMSRNKELKPKYTKLRNNPLYSYPVIKTQREGTHPYVVPNISVYVEKVFNGLFWWFDERFDGGVGKNPFRDFFGKHIFEPYIGLVLKDIFGEDKVKPEIEYTKAKSSAQFFDWSVEFPDRAYLFEVKGAQLSIKLLKSADTELMAREIKTKVVESVVKIYKKMSDINTASELAHFKGKKLIPVLVFYHIPLIAEGMYRDLIEEELKNLESDYPSISSFECYLMDKEDLEMYFYARNNKTIEEIFADIKDDPRKGFVSGVSKAIEGLALKEESLLDKSFSDFYLRIDSQYSKEDGMR